MTIRFYPRSRDSEVAQLLKNRHYTHDCLAKVHVQSRAVGSARRFAHIQREGREDCFELVLQRTQGWVHAFL
jgi:hypothetical protein